MYIYIYIHTYVYVYVCIHGPLSRNDWVKAPNQLLETPIKKSTMKISMAFPIKTSWKLHENLDL